MNSTLGGDLNLYFINCLFEGGCPTLPVLHCQLLSRLGTLIGGCWVGVCSGYFLLVLVDQNY